MENFNNNTLLFSLEESGRLERNGGKCKGKISHLLAYIVSNFIELKTTKREV